MSEPNASRGSGRPFAAIGDDPLHVPPLTLAFDKIVRPPGSKSLTNRVLLLAALADGTSEIRAPLIDADDARVMLRAIQQLGAKVEIQRARSASEENASALAHAPTPPPSPDTLRITGVGGRWKIPTDQPVHLNLNNAGTATRFLAASGILAPPGTAITIDGDERMRERPIRELAEALRSIGARVEFAGRDGFPPIRVHAGLSMGTKESNGASATIRFGRTQSSQFISAVLLIAPFLPDGIQVAFDEPVTSASYVRMTLDLLTRLGLDVRDELESRRSVRIGPVAGGRLSAFMFDVEPDASGATYFQAAAAISGSSCTIPGLDLHPSRPSLQGDTHFVSILTAFGAKVERLNNALRVTGTGVIRPIDADLSDMPDTAMTAAVIAMFASPTPGNPTATTVLRGLRTLRVKETDRLEALRIELGKLGAMIEIVQETHRGQADESLRITPPPGFAAELTTTSTDVPVTANRAMFHPPARAPMRIEFDTYKDHRMAMSLALIGLRRANVFIRDPMCVGKTYPGYWADLARLYA